jgi:gamma-glutamylcyclotransferase (GGCT)/AIG2-like uncharacterized protein YtfP
MQFLQAPTTELELMPVFVYGTLRRGGSLHHLLAPHIVEGPFPATTHGRLGAAAAGVWPVLLDGTGTVVGEVVVVRVSPESLAVLGVEELAWGYSLEWRLIETVGFTGRAVVCHWPWNDGFTSILEHGDWLKFLSDTV